MNANRRRVMSCVMPTARYHSYVKFIVAMLTHHCDDN